MITIDTVKFVATTIVGVGTSKIVGSIIKNNVDPQNAVDVVTVTAGSFVIGAIAADATRKYTDQAIDNAVEKYNSIKAAIAERQ